MTVTKDQIRAVFIANGFTIKEGQTDLKPYVYDAAAALLALASPQVAPAPVPDGFALVPVQMTKAMEYVTEQGDWEWSDLLAAAATPVQVAPPGWQPIKTAPERGIILLGLAPNEEHEDGYVSPGYWMESDDDGPDNMGHDAGFVDVHFDFFTCARSIGNPAYQHKGLQPTHWMPLPPAPGQVAPQDDARDAIRWRKLLAQDDESGRFAIVKNAHYDVFNFPEDLAELLAAVDALPAPAAKPTEEPQA